MRRHPAPPQATAGTMTGKDSTGTRLAQNGVIRLWRTSLAAHPGINLVILAAALVPALLISLLATTPAYYRQVSIAAHDAYLAGRATPDDIAAALPGADFDLRSPSLVDSVSGVTRLLLDPGIMALRVTGAGPAGEISVVLEATGFRKAIRMMFLAWMGGATLLIFLALTLLWHVMRYHYSAPLAALIETITEFSTDPSVATPIPDEMARSREFTAAAQALGVLQRNTLLALRQRERLADIGEAVAKINHDIRNVLSSATLVADTILASDDPRVRRAAPHIVRSLEQSVALVQSMMDYLADTPPTAPECFSMPALAAEIGESSGLSVGYEGPEMLRLDRVMMSRILLNLARNATDAGAGSLSIDVWQAGKLGVIDIADDGPGIPREHWDDLFLAFRSKRRGGTGLGLAIARDLAVAQGGALKLSRSNADGSEFRLQLPVEMFAAKA